ncbi:glutamyl-tRNA reductase [Flavobacteriaceae bacterium 14752]|uniref:glutamyl-tRNA reductase n=1 Tax=Mesohalobacter salilacus TaxID=2491711 RepID=UPI000F634255|nr:glutamyl-tRNA reductase [Flavobacteriaceae bacterium 14752]
MIEYKVSKYPHFCVIGLSYEKADAKTRGLFSLNQSQKSALLQDAKSQGLDSVMVVSTCNRTEVYGFAEHTETLINLLCKHSNGDKITFQNVGYTYTDDSAIAHLYRVAAGLDSQILGDFEIISQIKSSFNLSKKKEISNAFLERLVNSLVQTSRKIKNQTQISSGITSVSFASVQYILDTVEQISSKNILLFGTGKIGRNTCENLVKHTQNKNITLINRTKNKAEKIAGKFNLNVKDFSELQAEIRQTDVLIVATGAQQPTITKELIYPKKELLILDLSIPKNVADDVADLHNVSLLHLDHLSRMTDETLERRKQCIPKAKAIIDEQKEEFYEWLHTRKFAPTLQAIKSKLQSIAEDEIDYQSKKIKGFDTEQAEILQERMIHKITRQFASHLRYANGTTEEGISWLEKMFDLETESTT